MDTDGSRICKRECWTYSIRLTELAFRRAANSKSQKLSTFIATQTSQFVVLPQWAPLLPTAGFTAVAILTEKDMRRNDQSANGKIDQMWPKGEWETRFLIIKTHVENQRISLFFASLTIAESSWEVSSFQYSARSTPTTRGVDFNWAPLHKTQRGNRPKITDEQLLQLHDLFKSQRPYLLSRTRRKSSAHCTEATLSLAHSHYFACFRS